MDDLRAILQVVTFIFMLFIIVRVWMNFANKAGENIRRFLIELWRKIISK
ncbi:hypothetical protein PRVXT_001513 [Proteinivorax tanatarense]|uniref:Uncharacterized protein n=1 Tax=Proteinivorax tanatarense TaxID=1260629 RepID=A0AAU7VQ84_9FIRM